MARPSSKHPTELELEILKVLWRDGPSQVRHVRDAIDGFRRLAYTSVMTIMKIMVDKGYLRRRKKGNLYVYSPRLERESITREMVSDLVDRVFDGSPAAAALRLLETADIDENELRELRKLVQRKTQENRS